MEPTFDNAAGGEFGFCLTSKKGVLTEHIQATWTDLSNITRCQLVTKDFYDSIFKKNGFSHPYFILSLPYMDHAPYERVTGEIQFYLDSEIPRPLPWLEGAAIAFGRFYDGGKPWDCCPRNFLTAQEEKLKNLDIKMQVGFEIEFYLLNPDGSPVDATGYGDPKAFQGKVWKVLSGAIEAMKEFGIPVWKYHPEAAYGQYEIAIGPFTDTMLKAADSLVLARQAIYYTAASFGLLATLLPKPFEKAPGSSIHTNISLWNLKGESIFEVAPKKGKAFLAGIFNHLPKMMPIFCPIGNSYARLLPHSFSGGFHCIGTENRQATIRLFRDGEILKRMEVRTIDGASNAHMTLGSLIGAGMNGIQNGVELPPLVEVDPAGLPEEARPPLLPTSLALAIQEFSASPFNRELYGEELYNLILMVRKGEEAYWSSTEQTLEDKMKLLLTKF